MLKDEIGIYNISINVYFENDTQHSLSLSLIESNPENKLVFTIAPGESAIIRSLTVDSREDFIFKYMVKILLVDEDTGCRVTYRFGKNNYKGTLYDRSVYEQEKLSSISYNYTYRFTEKDFEDASCD